MKKIFIYLFILLIITLGLLWRIKIVVNVEDELDIVETRQGASLQETVEMNSGNELKITFLDVGQGDASLIQFSNGEKMLVDCGKDTGILSALGRVLPYYDRELDYLVITHPDSDHYGGCIDVLDRFTIKHIVYNGLKKSGDNFWEYFYKKMQVEGSSYTVVDRKQVWDISSSTINFIFPDNPIDNISASLKKKDNNTSLIFLLDYQGKKMLFMGDAENELEQYLINNYKDDLDSDILKVGHHGSAGSSGRLFLEAVSPAFSIISVGKDNTFGHPSLRVIKKLERTGSQILRTDETGDIVCKVGNTIECS